MLAAKERQILAVRIAIVTRSTQWEFDATTKQCVAVTPGPIKMLDDTVSVALTGDEKCYLIQSPGNCRSPSERPLERLMSHSYTGQPALKHFHQR